MLFSAAPQISAHRANESGSRFRLGMDFTPSRDPHSHPWHGSVSMGFRLISDRLVLLCGARPNSIGAHKRPAHLGVTLPWATAPHSGHTIRTPFSPTFLGARRRW